LALADHLLTIDPQVLPSTCVRTALRAAGDDEAPRDQRAGVVRPAGLHRQQAQVDLAALQHHLLAGRLAHHRRLHVPKRLGHADQLAGVFQTLRRLGFFQAREQTPDVAQLADISGAHAERDPFRRAEQVCQGRKFVTHRIPEPQRRASRTQNEVADRCHLQPRRDWLCDVPELARPLQARHELPQVTIFHT
jgi:hypothetical protein